MRDVRCEEAIKKELVTTFETARDVNLTVIHDLRENQCMVEYEGVPEGLTIAQGWQNVGLRSIVLRAVRRICSNGRLPLGTPRVTHNN